MRRLTMWVMGLMMVLTVSAHAQRFELIPGQSVGQKTGDSTVTTVVEAGAGHKMQFSEQPVKGPAVVATGTYQVSSNMGGEAHAKFTVASLTSGGKPVTKIHALGLDLKPGLVVTFSVRLEGAGQWNLTIFDAEIQPVLTREMFVKK